MQSNLSKDEIRLGGIVYTPVEVAEELSRITLRKFDKSGVKILEPSAGDGVFLAALKCAGADIDNIVAVDISEVAVDYLNETFEGLTAVEADFLKYASTYVGEGFDLIIGNPPYIRRHNYNETFSDELLKLSENRDYPLTQLKNAWAAFSLASINLLSDDGILAFVVPYELMTVHYGQTLQKCLVEEFHRVDIYIPDEKAFKKIDQDAVVFIASKNEHGVGGLHVHRVESLSELSSISSKAVDLSSTENLSIDLKSFLFEPDTAELLHKLRKQLPAINDYCESSAGIVTAANDYFILTKEEVERRGLKPWARKILKKGSFLSASPEFSSYDFDVLVDKEPCYLIDFMQSDSDELSDSALDYILEGEEREIHKRYKCQRREPWYRVPIVPVSEGFFFKRSHRFPRLCTNEAGVLVTDTAYQVRMKEGYSIWGLVYSFYNSLTLLFSEIDGRFYGGGVLELTPSEFKGLPLVYHNPSTTEYDEFVAKFPSVGNDSETLFRFGDAWLQQELQMSDDEIQKIQLALVTVRDHRLRHGAKCTQ